MKNNDKGLTQSLTASETAIQNMTGKNSADIIRIFMDDQLTCAVIQDGERSHTLTDLTYSWACCTCTVSKQGKLCWHHVAALLHLYPKVTQKSFSDTVAFYAGIKFGAHGFCHRGLGGMKPLCDRLSQLQKEGEEAEHIKQVKQSTSVMQAISERAVSVQPEPQATQPPPTPHQLPATASTSLTPSKENVRDGGVKLNKQLQDSVALTIDPQVPSPVRRQMFAFLSHAVRSVKRKAEEHKRGDCSLSLTSQTFEDAAGHKHQPNYSPPRHPSAACRRDTNKNKKRRPVPLEVVLEHGFESALQKSNFQKAQDSRKLPHGCRERGLKLISNSSANPGTGEER